MNELLEKTRKNEGETDIPKSKTLKSEDLTGCVTNSIRGFRNFAQKELSSLIEVFTLCIPHESIWTSTRLAHRHCFFSAGIRVFLQNSTNSSPVVRSEISHIPIFPLNFLSTFGGATTVTKTTCGTSSFETFLQGGGSTPGGKYMTCSENEK